MQPNLHSIAAQRFWLSSMGSTPIIRSTLLGQKSYLFCPFCFVLR